MGAMGGTNVGVTVQRIQWSENWQIASTSTQDFFRHLTPSSGQINNFAEFANCFDRYKVLKVKVTFRPRFDYLTGPTTGATPMTTRKMNAAILVDPYNTNTGLATGLYSQGNLNTFLENGGKIIDANKPFSMSWKPVIQMSTSVGFEPKPMPYLPTTNTTQTMYGAWVFFFQNGFGTTFDGCAYDVFWEMTVRYKDLR